MGRKPVEREIVQLRLSPEEYGRLKEEADAEGRSVPAEIRRRLALGRYGMPGAIGDLATIIAARADDALDQLFGLPELWVDEEMTVEVANEARRCDVLATTRDAFVKVLNDLGANDRPPASDQMTPEELVTGITWDLATRMRTRTGKDDAEGRILAHVAEGLGFRREEKPNKEKE